LDSTVIDLCLSTFPWATFRKKKAAVKIHTLLNVQGSIPTFIFVTPGSVHDVNMMDTVPFEADSVYTMDRAYLDFERLYHINQLSAFAPGPLSRCRTRQAPGVPYEQLLAPSQDGRRYLSVPMAGGVVLQMDKTTPAHKIILRDITQRGQNSNLDCRQCLFARGDC
jgi:hypothetical protein